MYNYCKLRKYYLNNSYRNLKDKNGKSALKIKSILNSYRLKTLNLTYSKNGIKIEKIDFIDNLILEGCDVKIYNKYTLDLITEFDHLFTNAAHIIINTFNDTIVLLQESKNLSMRVKIITKTFEETNCYFKLQNYKIVHPSYITYDEGMGIFVIADSNKISLWSMKTYDLIFKIDSSGNEDVRFTNKYIAIIRNLFNVVYISLYDPSNGSLVANKSIIVNIDTISVFDIFTSYVLIKHGNEQLCLYELIENKEINIKETNNIIPTGLIQYNSNEVSHTIKIIITTADSIVFWEIEQNRVILIRNIPSNRIKNLVDNPTICNFNVKRSTMMVKVKQDKSLKLLDMSLEGDEYFIINTGLQFPIDSIIYSDKDLKV